MIYNIEDCVLFNTDVNTLNYKDDSNLITLTLSQCMLLDLFLKSNNELLSKDRIIDIFWYSYGINVSSHTVTQYVSILRNIFSNFGIDDIITTLPREGFVFNAKINVKVWPEHEPSEKSNKTNSIFLLKNNLYLKFIKNKNIAFLILISSALIIFHMLIKKQDEYDFIFIDENKCSIGLIKNLSSNDKIKMLDQVNKIISFNQLTCDSNRMIYFTFYKTSTIKNEGKALLTYCVEGENARILSCDNYYYKNWRIQ